MLSFDSYSFGQSLALYPDQTAQFIDKGGIIAWGMVPTNNFTGNETADGLLRKLESYLDDLESKGISRQKLEEQALLTPSCGLGSLSIKNSKRILDLLMEMKKLIDG